MDGTLCSLESYSVDCNRDILESNTTARKRIINASKRNSIPPPKSINYKLLYDLRSSLDQLGHLLIDLVNLHSLDLGGLGSLNVSGYLGCLGSNESLTSERSNLLGFGGCGLGSLLSEEGGCSGEGELIRIVPSVTATSR